MLDVQADNVQSFKETCGKQNAVSWERCRAGCTERFAAGGASSESSRKDACTKLCDKKDKNMEVECEDQGTNLANMYAINAETMQAGSKCTDLHCKDFPQLLTTKEEERADKLKGLCETQCKDRKEVDECKSKCDKKCSLNNLKKCTSTFSKNLNVTVDYCTQLWQWMYKSEEIDPSTGNPVVL